jgi:hypothetical protein
MNTDRVSTDTTELRPGCEQIITLGGGVEKPCGRPCEYVYSKKLRDAGAQPRTHKFCSAHRYRRRRFGEKGEFTMSPVVRRIPIVKKTEKEMHA